MRIRCSAAFTAGRLVTISPKLICAASGGLSFGSENGNAALVKASDPLSGTVIVIDDVTGALFTRATLMVAVAEAEAFPVEEA